jgi:PHD/YefM family antitoxin component YafN of YafNO toxin-antitoxin module
MAKDVVVLSKSDYESMEEDFSICLKSPKNSLPGLLQGIRRIMKKV